MSRKGPAGDDEDEDEYEVRQHERIPAFGRYVDEPVAPAHEPMITRNLDGAPAVGAEEH